MQLTVKDYNFRLIDSLDILQMPLSKFPETFGLNESKYSKGDFPQFSLQWLYETKTILVQYLILNTTVVTQNLQKIALNLSLGMRN